ncbi:bifunctional hydroxymethylpyrimidine kinase/phosphomethylpyrimidine kinase [Chloracidobacterium validum]|uniref:Bifunctional hydroxymethylpyrimidine kinase/phosphomethylpyrimidine kinase n=1 Tax=Chloracidobacterium validum TaxID=2821543 RepID=A0ABX8B773_9BACT|nr:PfkB family carbohydrate kinase [Chloracidobacterium validum]QUW02763.1 bifunctional hydroxymethylpyrimidine kinase/phosphomethylpyrimidine kinase [Chloracidobacterium validum]
MPELSSSIRSTLSRFPAQHLLVIGDAIADEFVHGTITRVSREAPVLILRHEFTETIPGGAANAAANAAALGVTTTWIGVIGRDRPGRRTLTDLRRRGVHTTQAVVLPGRATPTKSRVLAGLPHAARQQVIRLDREEASPLPASAVETLAARVEAVLPQVTGVVLSDYGYGSTPPEVIALLRSWRQETGLPVVADSRHRLADFHGLTAATPNQEEAESLAGTTFHDLDAAGYQAERLRERLALDALLLTRGSEGMTLARHATKPTSIPVHGGRAPVDVTGAGDTVLVAFTAALAAGADWEAAMQLANIAAGIAVMKRGTATVSAAEIEMVLLGEERV